MSPYDAGPARRMLAAGVVGGACLAGLMGFTAEQASAATTARVQDGTLRVAGTQGPDTLALSLRAGSPTTLQVDVGGDGTADFSFDRTTFTRIEVRGRAGDDTLRVDQGGGRFTDEAVTLIGGAGDDTLTGGDGQDTLIGGGGRDTAAGLRGDDVALLGAGDDRFSWNPGDQSDRVEGQAGDDALLFNGSNAPERFDVSANGNRARLTRDVSAITMDLAGVERIALATVGGSDAITTGDLTGTGLRLADIDLGATGGGDDGAADTVVANATGGPDDLDVGSAAGKLVLGGGAATVQVAGGQANDAVQVRGLGGDDEITSGVSLTGPALVFVDGGEGADTTTYSGTAAADAITATADGTNVRVGTATSAPLRTVAVERLDVRGLGGIDTLTGSNGLAALTRLTLDGGDRDDVLTGGDGADVLLGGNGRDSVIGGRGDDVVLLGEGDDRLTWNPGDGSDAVEGQAGQDVLAFNGSNVSEQLAVAAAGRRVRLTRNVAAITMDMAGVERLALAALGGSDTITTTDLTGTDLRQADVDLGGGDGQADTIIANATAGPDRVAVRTAAAGVAVAGLAPALQISGSEALNDRLQLNTLAGDDTVTVAPDVGTLLRTFVDLGADG